MVGLAHRSHGCGGDRGGVLDGGVEDREGARAR